MNLFDELKNAGEELPIPESLSPDAIADKLQKAPVRSHKKEVRKLVLSITALAACILLLVALDPWLKQSTVHPPETNAAEKQEICELADNDMVTYDTIYQTMHTLYAKNQEKTTFETIDGMKVETSAPTEFVGNSAFSDTNKQVADVDEEDYIKTDGEYIYYLEQSTHPILHIVKADGGKLTEISAITTASNCEGFYLNGNQLILIETGTIASDFYRSRTAYTTLTFYDITDKSTPQKQNTLTMDGTYESSRIYNNYLYVFTSYYLQKTPDVNKPETYLPTFDGNPLSPDCITIPENPTEPSYLNIGAVNLAATDTFSDHRAILSGGNHQYYVSTDTIYAASARRAIPYFSETKPTQETNYTELFSFSYDNGSIKPKAAGKVPGILMDDFAMNAYNGYLRLVTTVCHYDYKKIRDNFRNTSVYQTKENITDNSLYVLDSDLTTIGKLEHLAAGERVYSARFIEDTGYFVTFRQIDPLFSVDLSDPRNPKLLNELKIPGFSEYLHPYSDTKLLGIGQEIDPDTREQKGLKLSMFDISSPSDVREYSKLVLPDVNYSEAWYDYKSVLIDPAKNLIGFGSNGNGSHYHLFQYEDSDGFIQKLDLTWDIYSDMRGLYIGDTFYVLNRNEILEAYSLETGEKLGELETVYEKE